jgi:uncharacterized protein YciI
MTMKRFFCFATLLVFVLFLGCGSGTAQSGAARPEAAGPMAAFVVTYGPGPKWVAGKPIPEQDIGPHSRYMDAFVAKGVVFAGGPYDDSHGIYLMKAKTAAEITSITDNDPGITGGVLTAEAHPWTVVMNRWSGTAPKGLSYYMMKYSPGPNWEAGKRMTEQKIDAHFGYVKRQFDTGRVVLAGPMGDADRGFYIILASGDDDMQQFVSADPGVKTGLFVAEGTRWNVIFGQPAH